MKKIWFIVSLLLLFILVGCGSSISKKDNNFIVESEEKENLINQIIEEEHGLLEKEKKLIREIFSKINIYKVSYTTKKGNIITVYADSEEEANAIRFEEGILLDKIVKPELLISNAFIKIDYGKPINIQNNFKTFSSIVGGKKIIISLKNKEEVSKIKYIELLTGTEIENAKTLMSISRLNWKINKNDNIELLFKQNHFDDNPTSASIDIEKGVDNK